MEFECWRVKLDSRTVEGDLQTVTLHCVSFRRQSQTVEGPRFDTDARPSNGGTPVFDPDVRLFEGDTPLSESGA